MKSIADALEPLQASSGPTLASNGQNAMILRKHAALVAEWEAVQDESDVLREELKEDKWLTVFRTVTDQADGMMSSLEKAVNRCQVRHYYLLSPHLSSLYYCDLGLHMAGSSVRSGQSISIPVLLVCFSAKR